MVTRYQVVVREPMYRRKARTRRIKSYFYGDMGDLCPHSTVVNFSDITIYKVGSGKLTAASFHLRRGVSVKTDETYLDHTRRGQTQGTET